MYSGEWTLGVRACFNEIAIDESILSRLVSPAPQFASQEKKIEISYIGYISDADADDEWMCNFYWIQIEIDTRYGDHFALTFWIEYDADWRLLRLDSSRKSVRLSSPTIVEFVFRIHAGDDSEQIPYFAPTFPSIVLVLSLLSHRVPIRVFDLSHLCRTLCMTFYLYANSRSTLQKDQSKRVVLSGAFLHWFVFWRWVFEGPNVSIRMKRSV